MKPSSDISFLFVLSVIRFFLIAVAFTSFSTIMMVSTVPLGRLLGTYYDVSKKRFDPAI